MACTDGEKVGRSPALLRKLPIVPVITTAVGFVLIAATTVVYGQSCPVSWELHGTKCFSFLVEGKNWEQSRTYCTGIGGSLVVLESADETDYLVDKMRAYNAHTFLGCRDEATEGHWICEGYDPSTTYFDYGGSSAGHWQTGGPFTTNGGTDENCMEIYHTDTSSFMNDVTCTTVNPLVSCQRDPVITTPQDPTTLPEQPSTAHGEVTTVPKQGTTAPGQVTTAPQQVNTASHSPTFAPATPSHSWFTSPKGPGHCLIDHVVMQVSTRLTLDCALRCWHAQWCASFNRIQDGGVADFVTCQLNDADVDETSLLRETVGCTTFNKLV